jgi:hypothetical protein
VAGVKSLSSNLTLLVGALRPAWPVDTHEGRHVAAVLDKMDVEHRWNAGQRVNSRTGAPLEPPVTDGRPHSHCSAFVAAIAAKLGVCHRN